MTWTETWTSWSPCGGDMLYQSDRAGVRNHVYSHGHCASQVRVFPKMAKTQTECKEGLGCEGEEGSTVVSLKQSPCARPWAETLLQGHSQIQGEDKNNLSSWWQCGQCSNRGIAVISVTAGIWDFCLPQQPFLLGKPPLLPFLVL